METGMKETAQKTTITEFTQYVLIDANGDYVQRHDEVCDPLITSSLDSMVADMANVFDADESDILSWLVGDSFKDRCTGDTYTIVKEVVRRTTLSNQDRSELAMLAANLHIGPDS